MVSANDIITPIVWGFIGLFGSALIVGGVWLFMWYSSYKHSIDIYDLVDDNKVVLQDRAAERKLKETGTTFYQTLKSKERIIGKAPPQARHIKRNGSEKLEVYRVAPGELVWRCDNIKHIIMKGEQMPEGSTAKENMVLTEWEPVTPQQRSAIVDGMMRAHSRKRMKARDFLLPIAGVIGIILILAVVLMFAETGIKPVMDVADKALVVMKDMNEMDAVRHERMMQVLEKFDILLTDTQKLESVRKYNET